MAVLDADFATDLTRSACGDTLWSPPIMAPASELLDWTSLLEEAEARIEEERGPARVAELRREELRGSARDARALANSLTRQLDTCRFKLKGNRSTLGGGARGQSGLNGRKVAASLGTASMR